MKPKATPLPPLFFLTDPARTPHPEDIAIHLPEGCGLIYRHFGEGHAPQRAALLKKIADDNGLILLIGDDEALAQAVSADGVHLPQRHLSRVRDIKADHPAWIITAACHDADTLRDLDMDSGLSAVFVSPVFASQSASAAQTPPIGVKALRALTDFANLPVYGLGGIGCDNILSLQDSGLSGIGAIDAFKL